MSIRITFRKFDSNNEFHRAQQNVRRDVQGLVSLDFGNNYDNRTVEIRGDDAGMERTMESLRQNSFDIIDALPLTARKIAA